MNNFLILRENNCDKKVKGGKNGEKQKKNGAKSIISCSGNCIFSNMGRR
jgi:hypothetical protein